MGRDSTDLTLDLTDGSPLEPDPDPTKNSWDDIAADPASLPVAPPAQPPGAGLTLSVTDPTFASPGYELTPYLPDKQRDDVRIVVTVGLLLMLAWIIVWASIESAPWPTHRAQTKEMLQIILPAVTGLIGSVIGFYFGSGVNSSNVNQSRSLGSGR